jgi:hypothetical protein
MRLNQMKMNKLNKTKVSAIEASNANDIVKIAIHEYLFFD